MADDFERQEDLVDLDDEVEHEQEREGFFPKTVIRECRVSLSREEQLARYQEYSTVQKAIDREVLGFRAAKDKHNHTIKGMQERAGRLIAAADSGFEFRDLECLQEYDFERALVTTYRSDTGEKVATRSMTRDEIEAHRQPDLFSSAPEVNYDDPSNEPQPDVDGDGLDEIL